MILKTCWCFAFGRNTDLTGREEPALVRVNLDGLAIALAEGLDDGVDLGLELLDGVLDVATALAERAEGVLDAAETRLFDLRALARKHRCEVDELPNKIRELRAKLDAIEGGEAQLDALRLAEREAYDAYEGAATRLRAGQSDLEAKLNELRSLVNQLVQDGFTTSRASGAFESSYEQFTTGATRTVQGIDGMAQFLEKAAQALQSTDEQLASQIGN